MAMKKFAVKSGRKDAVSFDPEDLVIVTDKTHHLYDARGMGEPDDALVRNIQAVGIIEPVVVTRSDGDLPLVIAGRRRVLAAREANKRFEADGVKQRIKVPAILRAKTDKAPLLFSIMVSENELREDDGPMARAQKAQRLIDLGGNTSDCALVFGVSTGTVDNWLRLLDASPKVRKAIDAGTIPPTAGYKLAKLDAAEQDVALAEVVAAGPKGRAAAATKTVSKRKAVAEGREPVARMRSRKAIEERLATPNLEPHYRSALKWVLGLNDVAAKVST